MGCTGGGPGQHALGMECVAGVPGQQAGLRLDYETECPSQLKLWCRFHPTFLQMTRKVN